MNLKQFYQLATSSKETENGFTIESEHLQTNLGKLSISMISKIEEPGETEGKPRSNYIAFFHNDEPIRPADFGKLLGYIPTLTKDNNQ